MMVCWLTLQILAASPVVNTVFMRSSTPWLAASQPTREVRAAVPRDEAAAPTEIIPDRLHSTPGNPTLRAHRDGPRTPPRKDADIKGECSGWRGWSCPANRTVRTHYEEVAVLTTTSQYNGLKPGVNAN